MKLVSVGIDPDHIGFIADHVSAELFDLQWPSNWPTFYKSDMFSLKNNICVWSSIPKNGPRSKKFGHPWSEQIQLRIFFQNRNDLEKIVHTTFLE